MTDYPPVRVTGAPDHEDFDGWLILATVYPDGSPVSIVGIEIDGVRDHVVVRGGRIEPREEATS